MVKLDYEIATVTPDGLLLNGLYYSSSALVRMKWFSQVKTTGFCRIPVMYDRTNVRHIILMDFDHFELASTVDKYEYDPEIVEVYHEAIQNLKFRLAMKRKE